MLKIHRVLDLQLVIGQQVNLIQSMACQFICFKQIEYRGTETVVTA